MAKEEGKPGKQALAVALSMARRSKVKKMAQGGQLPASENYLAENDSYPDPEDREFDMLDPNQPSLMADGGEVEDEEEPKMKRMKLMHKIFSSMRDND